VITQAELDRKYHVEQNTIAAAVAKFVLTSWLRTVDPLNISGTTAMWIRAAINAIYGGRTKAYTSTIKYLDASRKLQLPKAPPLRLPEPPGPPEELLLRSLTVTGPQKLAISLARIPDEPVWPSFDPLGQGLSPLPSPEELDRERRAKQQIQVMREEAKKAAGAAAAASAYKQVQYGGRDTVDHVFRNDKSVEAWIRVTSDHPCGFCLMLASRGPVYVKDSFDESDARFNGPGNWKCHDNCGCTGRLVWKSGKDGGWTPLARQADELWQASTEGKSGNDAINAFRAAARAQGLADLTRW